MRETYDRLYGGNTEQEAFELLESQTYGQLSLWDEKTRQPVMVFMHYAARPSERCILGHLANRNPALELLAADPRATFWVEGPSAYIPSYWVDPEKGVPTSYYSWAQFEAEAEIVRDPDGIVAILEEMLARLQPEGRHPPLDMGERHWQGLVGAITGLRLNVTSCASRHKYGQNKSAQVRGGVVEFLRARGTRDDSAVAEKVLQHLETGQHTGRAAAAQKP